MRAAGSSKVGAVPVAVKFAVVIGPNPPIESKYLIPTVWVVFVFLFNPNIVKALEFGGRIITEVLGVPVGDANNTSTA